MKQDYTAFLSLKGLTALVLALLSFSILSAQTHTCGTDHIHQNKMGADFLYKLRQSKIETETRKYVLPRLQGAPQSYNTSGCTGDGSEKVYRIPVVVHVMHLPADNVIGTGSNLSDATVQAGIDHMNDAFRNTGSYAGGPFNTNATAFGAISEDVRIEFYLAQRDPSGNSTTGINRVSTSYSNLFRDDPGPAGFASEDAYLKSLSFWDSRYYANVWLINEICTGSPNTGCGVAGYAYLAGAHGQSYDGIVNEARFWGSSENNSKVHTHEFGHYLNLYHTFNDPDGGGPKTACTNNDCLSDGDFVCDTPPDNSTSATSCASSGTINSCATDADDTSANNPFTSNVQDMYENYMDYGFQSCQNTFTNGQKLRMRAALTGIRSTLLESEGCVPVTSSDAAIAEIISPASTLGCGTFNPTVALKNFGTTTLTSAQIKVELDGVPQYTFNWTGSLVRDAIDTVSLTAVTAAIGTHTLTVYSNQPNGNTGPDGFSINDTVYACFDIYAPASGAPYCSDFESGPYPPTNWSAEVVSATTWSDYQSGTGCTGSNGSVAFHLDSWQNSVGASGATVDLALSSFDLINYSSATLDFDYAYSRTFSNRTLEMEVSISTDCGASYTVIDYKSDAALATTSGFFTSGPWSPGSCADWDSENITLTPYVGNVVLVRFRAIIPEFYSQNIYLDNICIDGVPTAGCSGLSLTTSQTNATCGLANGSATVTTGTGTAPFTYSWDTTPVQTNATATGLAAGTYKVIVEDVGGCRDSATVVIQNTGSAPVAAFTKTSASLTTSFTDNSTGTPTSWFWDFGDGNTSTVQNPGHTYSTPGTYTVCLTTTNSCGSDSSCQSVTVTCPGPNATFLATSSNLAASFTDISTGSPTFWFWDFGDGNTSTLQSPNHTYASSGTYTVCLIASNLCGADTSCQSVTISCPIPNTTFGASVFILTATFTDNSTGTPNSWLWDFGDGNTSTIKNPIHTYATPGTYMVCLTATNSCGSDSSCQFITVACPAPNAAFTATSTNLAASFTDNSTGTPTSWFWDFGDGNTSTAPNAIHTYASTGTYTVCLTVSNLCGTDSSCQAVNIICPKPNTAFAATTTNLTASFTDNSTGTPASWLWDFGDGNTSTAQNPVHSYSSPGTYSVCLTATNACGSDSSCQSVTVSCPAPNAAFAASTTNLGASFTDNSTGAPTLWFWDFGDGNTSTAQNPTHTYAASGTYTVCLLVNNVCGSDTSCQSVTINCPPPNAAFSSNANLQSVSFTDNSTGTPTSWLWDFGDGNTSLNQNPGHFYATPGTYTVCLTVSNACGSDSTCQSVTATCPVPNAAFAATSNNLVANFADNSTGTPFSWSWDFGDGATSTAQNPAHTYTASGTYTVCLVSTNVCGSDTTCQSVTVSCPAPNAAFAATSNNLAASFTDNSTGTPTSWFWDFGDGNTSTTQSPTHTYVSSGTYTVCLTVSNACGTDSSCQSITVVCPTPNAAFTTTSTNLTASFTDNSTGTPTSWGWDFGDGTTSTVQNPTHTYSTAGTYTVCLLVDNACGIDTSCQTITIVCPAPNTAFTASTNNLVGSFTDNTTGTPTSWLWDFGDGNTSTQQNPNHTYASSGSYTVCLTATNACGSDSSCQTVSIVCPVPNAAFTATATNLAVSFTDNSTGALTSWLWDFGDGNTSTLQSPNHTYTAAGVYTVCLTTTNACGSDSVCQSVTAVTCQLPVATFSQNTNGQTATFTDNSTGSPGTWLWDFGDGNTSTLSNPSHTYTNAGTYTVCLTATNSCGSDSTCQSVTITCTGPIARFLQSSTNKTATFTNTSSPSISRLWDFGDGNTSTVQNPTHTYAVQGTYTVCLIVTDLCGSDTLCQSVVINCPLPVAGFTYSLNNLTATISDNSTGATTWTWDMGDGNISFVQNPVHAYAGPGVYTVCLLVTGPCGVDTTCQVVTVNCPVPVAGFTSSSSNLSTTFTDISTNATSWVWDFGDGNTSTLQNPIHTYAGVGTYTTCLIVHGNCGIDTTCQPVTVTCPTVVSGYSSSVNNLSAAFTDASTNATFWFWDFGDGNTSILQNPIHTYTSSGTYTACLVASNNCDSDTLCQAVTIVCPTPAAGFSFTTTGLTTAFTDASTGTLSWSWDFGDGNTSFIQNPVHTYGTAGVYTVCLVATNTCGSDTSCQVVTLTCPTPTPGFTFTQNQLATSFVDGSNGATSWTWDFGDGNTSTQQNPNHSYLAAGTYTVCQVATNGCGSDSTCQVITVICPVPAAGFTFSSVELMTNFTDASTGGTPGGNTWSWDFGDGGTSTLQNPTHNYSLPGTYTVCLTVTNACGPHTSCETVTVNCTPPFSAFAFQSAGLAVTFFNASTSNAQYLWEFGDGISSSQFEPQHTYSSPGSYLVSLIVTNPCGRDTITNTVNVTLTAIDPLIGKLDVVVYPNPNTGQFVVEVDGVQGESISWKILDVRGRKVYEATKSVYDPLVVERFDLSDHPEGVYILKTKAGNRQHIQKVVIGK